MQDRVFEGRLRSLKFDRGLPPSLEKVLLRHVVAALERESYDFLASDAVLICEEPIVLILPLSVIRELPNGGYFVSQVGHDAVLSVFESLLSLHLHVLVPDPVNLILTSHFDRIHHFHQLLLQPVPVLGVRDKLLKELLNKSLSKECPGLDASLVTFDVLDDKISLLTVLYEGQTLETALILDELSVQN
jgi:hypothetical protein